MRRACSKYRLMGQGASVDTYDSAIKFRGYSEIFGKATRIRSEPIKLAFLSDQFSDEHVRREVYPLKRRVLFVWISMFWWRPLASRCLLIHVGCL